MANRHISGFGEHNTTSLAYEWIVRNTVPVVSGISGFSDNCVRLTGSSTAGNSGQIYITAAPEGVATFYYGFRFMYQSTVSYMFGVGDTTRTHLILSVNPDGTLTVYRANTTAMALSITSGTALGTSAATVIAAQAYYIEIGGTINDTTGSVEVRLNGNSIISLSNVDTNNAGTNSVTWAGHTWVANGQVAYIDDIYFNDSSGSVCNGFMGDSQIDFHLPDADGANTAWTPSTGTSHYQLVDENPPNTTDYNSTSTLNAKDTYSIEAFKNGSATIYAIQMGFITQKSGIGSCGIASVIRESGVDTVNGSSMYPNTTWGYLGQVYSLAVGDAKRAAAGFDAAEYGMSKTV